MFFFRLLPWEYAIRNLFRRPLRTALTFAGLTTVVLLVFVVVGFIRGLEKSLAVSGDPQTAIVFSLGMGQNLEYSSISMSTNDLVAASVEGIQERYGQKYVSPELYLGHGDQSGRQRPAAIRPGARRDAARSARAPPGASLNKAIGRNRAKCSSAGLPPPSSAPRSDELAIGNTIHFEDRDWRISGMFSRRRRGLRIGSLVPARRTATGHETPGPQSRGRHARPGNRNLQSRIVLPGAPRPGTSSDARDRYYATLQKDYRPVRMLAWFVVLLVAGAGIFAGLNTMYGAAIGRIRELATLQTIGFARRAMLVSLVQEGAVLAAAASLFATMIALVFVNNAAIRFTMGAFSLRIDEVAVLIGCSVGLAVGIIGAVPPAIRAMKMPVVDGLKSI